jgi:type I restriction enzyme S subunit
LHKDDIIFNNTNSVELVGKTILIKDNLPYAFSNHLTRLKFDQKEVMSEWILAIFQKLWREKYFESICTRWVGQAGINQTSLGKIKIPFPPLAEQNKIVARLDGLSEKVQKLQALQETTERDLKALKRAVLERAFKGEL